MITTIRKSFTKGAKESFGIIILFALVGGMLFVPGAIENIGSEIWAIKVNDRVVDYQSYMREVMAQKERLNAFRAQYGQFADYFLASMGVSTDPKRLALDTLIKEELLNQLSDDMTIFVHPDYVNEKLNDKEYVQNYLRDLVPLFVFDENNKIDIEKLQQILPKMGLTAKEFRQKLDDVVSRQFLMSLVSSTTYTPEFDRVYTARLKNSQRKFSMATISLEDILEQEKLTEITQEEVVSYFELNNRMTKKYWIPEKRSGVVWKINAENYGISVSENQITTYYEDNKTKKFVDTPTQIVMQQIVQTDITGPLTDIYQDIASGKSDLWADVEPFPRGTYDDKIERAAFTMKKGDISPIIITKGGAVVVIKLIDRIARTYKPLSQVEDEIRSQLITELFKKQFVTDVTAVIKKKSTEAFDQFISQNSLRAENIENVLKNSEYGKQLFALKQGEYDVYVKNSTGYIIELTSIIKSFQPELESIADVVKNDIYEDRAQDTFKKEVETKTQELIKNKDAFKAQSLGWINPEDKNQEKELQKQGIPLRLLNNLEKEGSVISHNTPDKGMIFILEDIKVAPVTSLTEDELDFDQMRKMTAMEGLVASLYRNAKIETNETIIIASEEYSA